MAKYIDRINLRSSAFYLSADHATSAGNSTFASGYTFDPQIAFFDDYVDVFLDHPYRYSPQTVSSLDQSDIMLSQWDYSLSAYDMPINVYNDNHDIMGAANIHSYVFNANSTSGTSCLVESIDGHIQQTATEQQNIVDAQWVVPIKFKVASTYMAIAHARLWQEGTNQKNAFARDGAEFWLYDDKWGVISHILYQATDCGTTVPAILFKEAGIADIPVYDATDTSYRLNTQVFDSLGNNAHISATSAHEFVKFCKALQNLAGEDYGLEYATVKANAYSHSALYHEVNPGVRWINVHDYSILTANVTDTQKACGVIDSTAANPLKYAFYDEYGNYKMLTANNNTIYDEYTYYCVLPTANYATSAAATAAIQTLIDNRTYWNAGTLDSQTQLPIYMYGYGTLNMEDEVFNSYDEILDYDTAYTNAYRPSDHVTAPCIPFAYQGHIITAFEITGVNTYRNIKTFITKPQIDIANVQRRTQITYTYNFGSLYVVNSAFTAYNTSANNAIYKAAAYNMIQYSNSLVAPTEQCTATCFGADILASTYYNFCYHAYRNTKLPTSAQVVHAYANATDLLPVAVSYSKTIDSRLETLPTRDIYYCLTMSK